MRYSAPLMVLALGACVMAPAPAPVSYPPEATGAPLSATDQALDPQAAARNFSAVVGRMEPVAERECRARRVNANCDFRIVVDTTPGAEPNAFQTQDGAGRPIIAFTVRLIGLARNQDELAFVMGHEASHYILAHMVRQERTAMTGAILTGVATAALGGDPTAIQQAQQMGASLGARAYSKDMELEADQMGTILAWEAGFDPLRGAQFFNRLPDPGDDFLGTHPPNAQRLQIVRQTMAAIGAAP